jgi:signal transduction histidine kinase
LLLTQETLKAPAGKGNIVVNQVEYSYLKSPIHENQDTLIVFQNYERERSALNFLITALSIVGLVCLILSFFGSLFMASHAMIPIQKAWQQQKDFLADASHELRTPLAVIQTNLEIVQSEHQKTNGKNIQEATTNMSKLVDSLLFLSGQTQKNKL